MFSNVCGLIRYVRLPFVVLAILLIGVSIFAQNGNNPNYPLPQTPPAPGILVRESFGWGPNQQRPRGDQGVLFPIESAVGTSINDLWVEYPGSSRNRWIAPESDGRPFRVLNFPNDGWYLTYNSETNPFELPSPLQIVKGVFQNGGAGVAYQSGGLLPTAILPLPGEINAPIEVGIEAFVQQQPDPSYISLGFTNSDTTKGNLVNFGSLVLTIKYLDWNTHFPLLLYELRANGSLVAQGITSFSPSTNGNPTNRLRIRYIPQTNTISAQVNDVIIGPFTANIGTPKYSGFEGYGIVDNFVIRAL
jgi:hypothetical protein